MTGGAPQPIYRGNVCLAKVKSITGGVSQLMGQHFLAGVPFIWPKLDLTNWVSQLIYRANICFDQSNYH